MVSISILNVCFLPWFYCFIILIISLLMFTGTFHICGNSILIGMLNNSVAGLDIPTPIGVDLIPSTVKLKSLLFCLHFLTVHFMNLIHASTCPLSWWWYDKVTAWSIFRCLQNTLKYSETKFVLTSETNFLSRPDLANTGLVAHIRSSVDMLSTFFHYQEFAVVINNT